MQLIRAREVRALTGVTPDQLREWTVRRGLVQPDVPSRKRGCEAQFSWRTLLVLRLTVVLRTRFHIELQAHRALLVSTRRLLEGASLTGLWGATLAIYGLSRCELLSNPTPAPLAEEDAILLRLNPHLEALSRVFGVPEPALQLSLFSPVGIRVIAEDSSAECRSGDRIRL